MKKLKDIWDKLPDIKHTLKYIDENIEKRKKATFILAIVYLIMIYCDWIESDREKSRWVV